MITRIKKHWHFFQASKAKDEIEKEQTTIKNKNLCSQTHQQGLKEKDSNCASCDHQRIQHIFKAQNLLTAV